MRERRIVVNTGNRPCCDNGEGEGRLSLTHYRLHFPTAALTENLVGCLPQHAFDLDHFSVDQFFCRLRDWWRRLHLLAELARFVLNYITRGFASLPTIFVPFAPRTKR